MFKRHRHIPLLLIWTFALAAGGCDAVHPDQTEALVVEAWLETDRALPPIRLSSTLDVGAPLDPLSPQGDVQVEVEVDGQIHAYLPLAGDPLRYAPADPAATHPRAGQAFEVRVLHEGRTARAHGVLPPVLHLLRASFDVPDEPVPVVLLDSLQLGLDSLALDIEATTGFVYPVQVAVTWQQDDFEGWIEARLQPSASFSSSLLNFFLLPSQVFSEASVTVTNPGELTWEGVYAVPVANADSPLPTHDLRIVLLRSNDQYARFATSRTSPLRREPVSNVSGGLGFVAGISVDSLRLNIRK